MIPFAGSRRGLGVVRSRPTRAAEAARVRHWIAPSLVRAALVVAVANVAVAQLYSVRDLGLLTDLPGRTLSMPNAINNLGKAVAANVTNGAYRALLFGGAWTNLGTLGGGESFASGLNDAGRVVGHSIAASGATRAFLWTPGGTDGVPSNPQMKDLGTLGGVNSEAYDINTSGQISGYADTAGDQRAFRYSGGVMTDIGALLGNTLPNSYGYSINDAGHVAGTAYNRNYTMWHAFLYNGSQAVTIERPDNKGSSALSINNRGSIAGYLVLTSDVEHAFFYSGGVITDLGTLGGNYSYGIGLNNSNVVVGGSFVDTNESVYHAFLWAGNSMKDLNDLLDASGSGWVLTEARSINDSGQIVGVGRRGGVNRAFLLNPVPKITRLNTSGTNVLVSFTSINTAPYVLESRDDVAKGSWSNTVTGLSGNGGTLTATNRGAATLRQRFYRAKLLTP